MNIAEITKAVVCEVTGCGSVDLKNSTPISIVAKYGCSEEQGTEDRR